MHCTRDSYIHLLCKTHEKDSAILDTQPRAESKDSMMHYWTIAGNMAIYPDGYTILQMFLVGVPAPILNELLGMVGLSPETNTLDDFVAHAKEVEQRTKNKSYYIAMRDKENLYQKRGTAKEAVPKMKASGNTSR